MTRIILFIHQSSGQKGKTFLRTLKKNIIDTRIETCSTIEAFEKRIVQSKNHLEKEIIVLFTDSKDRLDQLYLKNDILQAKKTVLILPGKNHEIMSRVHRFFPRYFCFMDDKYTDLCEVLNKMVTQY